METSSWALTVMAWLAALAFLSKIFTFKRHQPKFPPGPKPWPIVGNLNLIGALPHQSLHKLSQKYGPIMHLKLGSVSVVVASSPEMAKQFLKTHDHVFASRPQPAAGKHISYDYSDILWAPYGPYFRQARKIYMSEIFTPKRLESYEYIRVEERSALLSRLHALSGNPTKVKEQLVLYTLSVISRVALGKKYFSEFESESETSAVTFKEFLEMLDEWFVLNSDFNVGDWIPWLKFLDLQGFVKRMKALRKRFDRFHDHVFDDHKAKREERDFVPKDMVDLMLQLADDPNTDVKLTYDNLKGLTQVHNTP
jgi:cytochrome P450